jgi:hypothetical protein
MEFSTIDEAWMCWISYGGQNGLRLEKDTQIKERQMGRFGPTDMFMQMRIIGNRIKGIT